MRAIVITLALAGFAYWGRAMRPNPSKRAKTRSPDLGGSTWTHGSTLETVQDTDGTWHTLQ